MSVLYPFLNKKQMFFYDKKLVIKSSPNHSPAERGKRREIKKEVSPACPVVLRGETKGDLEGFVNIGDGFVDKKIKV